MTEKVFNLVSDIIYGVETISVAIITYCVQDAQTAAIINSSILIAGTAAIEICKKFVKK